MPLFSRFKNRGATPASKKNTDDQNGVLETPQPARWQAQWNSTTVVPDEVAELVHLCTAEMKTRAEALDSPFVLLPFRINSDPQGGRLFISNFFKQNAAGSPQYRGESLKQELRLTDSLVLCSIIKWCWSRMPSGVVSWPVYEGFQIGEKEANMARNAFTTFIPIGADSDARKSIIIDFYDLLTAVAAHGKNNGLGGRKLSRMAGWWAFELSDEGNGFEGGYKSWTKAADASSHLFFAYLRSLSPDTTPSMNVIERIPRSLQALMASTEYPPETPTLLQRSTPRVVMMVDTVSPTPFALLRRAKHFEFRDRDQLLRAFAEFEDPIDALTPECKRVLYAVATTNQSAAMTRSRQTLGGKPDESWSAFENLGFSDLDVSTPSVNAPTKTVGRELRSEPQSRNADGLRPTTPSWADFLSSGFIDDGGPRSPALLYPPSQVLPPLGSRSSSPALAGIDENLSPGELAAIASVELDDAFWWVWMTSLAGEEPSQRKAVFGRCALIETTISNGAWLIMEEQVKGASPEPTEGVFIAPKKSLFSFTKRGRLGRKRSVGKAEQPRDRAPSATPSKASITNDQHAKIKAAARELTRKQSVASSDPARATKLDDSRSTKTSSMLTLGIQSEAGPAMKWASSYDKVADKNALRQNYLGDSLAGKGMSREDLVRKTSSNNLNADNGSTIRASSPISPDTPSFQPESLAQAQNRELPPLPAEEASPEPEPPAPTPVERAPSPHILHRESVDLSGPSKNDAPLEKEIEATAAPAFPKPGRKPVPHPALRDQTAEQPSAAALAAQKAMQTSSDPKRLQKSMSNNAGFKKFFGGKKKDSTLRDNSFEAQRPGSNSLSPPMESSFGRRLSQMRKKNSASPVPRMYQAPATPTTVASRSSFIERQEAERSFARFDQGPVDDIPAVLPTSDDEAEDEEGEHDPSPLLDEDKFNVDVAHHRHSVISEPSEHTHFVPPSPPARGHPADDNESEITMEDHQDPHVVQDRWAQIRDNAHKRAEHQRQSEDYSELSRPSRMTDDGETSGEETIESRVARIKARVAELTGNMESASRA